LSKYTVSTSGARWDLLLPLPPLPSPSPARANANPSDTFEERSKRVRGIPLFRKAMLEDKEKQ